MVETFDRQLTRLFKIDERIADLRAELRELTDERRELAAGLGQHAAVAGKQSLRNEAGIAYIRTRREVHFPTKSEDTGASDRLRLTIQRTGQWDLVSDLCYPRLKSLWLKNAGMPPNLRSAIAPFATERTTTTISCKAKDEQPSRSGGRY